MRKVRVYVCFEVESPDVGGMNQPVNNAVSSVQNSLYNLSSSAYGMTSLKYEIVQAVILPDAAPPSIAPPHPIMEA
jgi:hypothetical protein